jgi:dTDP-4-amino-4,6-dideoxygalactose transaminase
MCLSSARTRAGLSAGPVGDLGLKGVPGASITGTLMSVRPLAHSPVEAPAAPAPIRLQHPELPAPERVMEYFELSRLEGWYSNGGPCARLLTDRLGAYLGGGVTAVPVANCTVGLLAALRATMGTPQPRRRLVLTPSFTFTATACAIEWAGFEPVFVDVEPEGWHIDPSALQEALERFGSDVAGVLACATFGTAPAPAQRAAWRALCDAHGVPLVVDSAAGFGSTDIEGRPLGAVGDVEVFSFHATKPFAIGEGGCVVAPDPQTADRLRRIINFGLEPGTRVSVDAGFNGKMSELHAATALAMLDDFPEVLATRRAAAEHVRLLLSVAGVTFQAAAERSTWQMLQLGLPTPATRNRAVELAPAHGIEVRTMQDPPLHRHPAFQHCRHGRLDVTERLAARGLSLPMANSLGFAELERIADLVLAAV